MVIFKHGCLWLKIDKNLIILTSRLIDEERDLTTTKKKEIALAASTQNRFNYKNNQKKIDKSRYTCFIFNKKRHFARDCRLPRRDNQKFKPSKSDNNYSAFSVDNSREIATEIIEEEGWILGSGHQFI